MQRTIREAAIAVACVATTSAAFAAASITAPEGQPLVISAGSIANEALTWVMTVFGSTIGALGTWLLVRALKWVGINASDALRARLQEFVVNGLNRAEQELATQLRGKSPIDIKNAYVARAVRYVQEHGGDTLKDLGLDPNANKTVDAIKARIETAIKDPTQPTPPILDTITLEAKKGG